MESAKIRGHYPDLVVVDGQPVAAVRREEGRVYDADDRWLGHLLVVVKISFCSTSLPIASTRRVR